MKILSRASFVAAFFAVAVLAAVPLYGAQAHVSAIETMGNLTPTSTSDDTGGGAPGDGGADDATSSGDNTTTRKSIDGVRAAADTASTDASSARETRLNAAKLKVCERRQANIQKIMNNSRERARKQIDLFTTIAERTEVFYAKKGKTLSNYDELVAAVTAAKSTAETDLAALPTTFDCSGGDPKGAASSFKTAHQQLLSDLKAYRQAVKDLIVGVKSVQGDA